ncbi:ABC transporter ATP-binding protein [Fundicoccus sp. Sow4_H7]|uniref:ABC transporter ATP-binding protein n=1 Tax=Fundicoccus sp. Sow4_H7 TaxID=3438784 RepID=UPI003F90CB76
MLTINALNHNYNKYPVLKDITLSAESGQTVAILGTSGVGKTTLFNLIAGILPIQSGTIEIEGSQKLKEKVAYMLQKDMLLAHKSIIENVMLPMLIQGQSKKEARKKARALLEQFDLDEWADYYPKALSGGMRQRIAFIRTTAFDRDWLLLDEAFSALDAITRRLMHHWFMDYRKQIQASTLLITHDVDEAIILSDKIYVLKGQPGEIVAEFHINIHKDNFEELIFLPEFLDYKKQLLAIL